MPRFRFAVSALVLASVAGGCGGSNNPAPAPCALPKDGTRLKAIRLQADDGSWENRSRHGEWYDAGLGTYCSLYVAADGVPRCLPSVAIPASDSYADAACTQRVTTARRCLGTPQHAIVPLAAGCAGKDPIHPYAVYALGDGSIPDATYYRQSDGSCIANPNLERSPFFPLLAEVPPAEFVAVAFERTAGSRIQGNELAAEDGARGPGPVAAYDSTFGGYCQPMVAADGEARCLPYDTFLNRPAAFADASCTQGLVVKPESMCNPAFSPAFVGIQTQETCAVVTGGPVLREPKKTHVYRVSPPSTPAEIFQERSDAGGGPRCEASPNTEARQYGRVGVELGPTEFALATDTETSCGPLGASGRRLKAHHLVFEDGTLFSRSYYGAFLDADTGQDCSFRTAADDVLRCLPSGQLFSFEAPVYFADAGCSQPLIPTSRCDEYRRGVPKYAISSRASSGACIVGGSDADAFRTHVYALGGAVTPSAVYVNFQGTPADCVSVDENPGALADLLQLYELRPLGPEVPPSTFVAGSIATP
jgi:hypothetical protein